MDPFFQQVSDIRERWKIVGNGSIPIMTQFSPRRHRVFTTGIDNLAVTDSTFAQVVPNFFFGNGSQPVPFGNVTRPAIPISCPSHNCTWEPHDTLAVCSTCSDISDLLSFDCRTTDVDWTMNLTGGYDSSRYLWGPRPQLPRGRSCGYYLNGTSQNPVLMSGYLLDSSNASLALPSETLLMRTIPMQSSPMRETIYDGSIKFKHIRNPITNFIISGSADGTYGSVRRNETPVCHECILHWCVKRIQSTYYQGEYREKVIQTFVNNTPGPFPWKVEKRFTPANLLHAVMLEYLENVTINVPDSPKGKIFGTANQTHISTGFIFDEILPSFYTQVNTSNGALLRYNNLNNHTLTREMPVNPWIPPGNVTNHVVELGLALTNTMRTLHNSEPLNGTSFDIERYVHVEWPWLTFPVMILCMSLVFLVATVLKTEEHKDQVGVWKSSAMATLMYGGITEGLQQQSRNSNAIGTPRTRARKMKARLLPNKQWSLSAKTKPSISESRINPPN